MLQRIGLIVLFLALSSCRKDNPRHQAKEMIGTYEGSWTFTRTSGTTTETGLLEVDQGPTKTSVCVGPDRIEFELDGELQPTTSGSAYQLSFPDGNTTVIRFERTWDSQSGTGSDVFIGSKK